MWQHKLLSETCRRADNFRRSCKAYMSGEFRNEEIQMKLRGLSNGVSPIFRVREKESRSFFVCVPSTNTGAPSLES